MLTATEAAEAGVCADPATDAPITAVPVALAAIPLAAAAAVVEVSHESSAVVDAGV